MNSSRYKYTEPSDSFKKQPNLNLEQSSSPRLRVFRLLSGTASVTDTYSDKTYKFRRSYFHIPYKDNSRVSARCVLDIFSEDDISLRDINNMFANNAANFNFFSKIEGEIIRCLISIHKESYIDAFVHLYRIIECMTYATPLLYASKSKDYIKTYESLKSCFTNTNSGELGFFITFVKNTFQNEDFIKLTIDLSLSSEEYECDQDNLRKLIVKHSQLNGGYLFNGSPDDIEFEFDFLKFFSFLIILRNRFFHLLQGGWKENISRIDTEYPELLFKAIINSGLNWTAIIIFEILKLDIAKNSVDNE